MQEASDVQGDPKADVQLHGLPEDVAGAQQEVAFALGRKLDLRSDSVSYVCARIRKWYGQRIEFPVPRDIRRIIAKLHLPGCGWVVNGIFCGVFKTGPNPKNPFFCGGSINGETELDWKICLRDVLVKNDMGEEHMIFSKRRSRNKRHPIEFSIKDFMPDALEEARRIEANIKIAEKISDADIRASLERAVEARAVAKAKGIDLDDD